MAFIRPYEKRDFEATAHICRETLPPSLRTSPAAQVLAPYLWTHQYTHLSQSTCFVLDDGTGAAVGYCIGCPSIPEFLEAYPAYVSDVLDSSADVLALRPSDPLAPAEPWAHADGSINGACLAQLAHDPQRLLLADSNAAVAAARYPATLHIDLLEPWQRRGWGARLLERTVGALAGEQRELLRRQRCAVPAGNEAAYGGDDDNDDGDDGRRRTRQASGGGGGVWVGVAEDNAKVVPFYQRMGFRLFTAGGGSDQDAPQHQERSDSDPSRRQADSDDDRNGEKAEAERGAEEGRGKRKGDSDDSDQGGGGGGIVLVREFLGGPAENPGGTE